MSNNVKEAATRGVLTIFAIFTGKHLWVKTWAGVFSRFLVTDISVN